MRTTRRLVQTFFFFIVIVGVFVFGGNCERWCPFGGVEAIYTYVAEGNMLCSLGTSNFFLLGGVLLATLILRRAFCGYLCPIGLLSEWSSTCGKWLRLPSLRVVGRVDRVLAVLKYVVLAAILFFTWRTGELVFRGYDPCYALISRHGEDIRIWAYVVAGAILATSLVVSVPFCRWVCPFAAVLNFFSRFGIARIRRHTESCHACGRCAKTCPMAIPVDEVEQVTAARCISCMNCVEVCPGRKGVVALTWGPSGMPSANWTQTILIGILLLCTMGAVAASYAFPLPSFVKVRGTPPAHVTTVELRVENLTCRGRANLLYYWLDRDDLLAIPGYLKIEAWPGPNLASIRISFDTELANEGAVKQAITEPYFDSSGGFWRSSPFVIEAYDPLELP